MSVTKKLLTLSSMLYLIKHINQYLDLLHLLQDDILFGLALFSSSLTVMWLLHGLQPVSLLSHPHMLFIYVKEKKESWKIILIMLKRWGPSWLCKVRLSIHLPHIPSLVLVYSCFLNRNHKIIPLEVGAFGGQGGIVQLLARDFCCSTRFICESDVRTSSGILPLTESIPVALSWFSLGQS